MNYYFITIMFILFNYSYSNKIVFKLRRTDNNNVSFKLRRTDDNNMICDYNINTTFNNKRKQHHIYFI